MGTIEKNVSDEVREANRANSEASTGPATEAGKKQSSMNALKHGRYAKRLDPVKQLLADLSQEEEAERESLRAEVIQSYQPPDAFARQQAEGLADLQFQLSRLEGVKQVIWQRERELLELEQRRRALRLKQEGVGACAKEVSDRGLVNQPDSPSKFREMLRVLEMFAAGDRDLDIEDVRVFLNRLYGDGERSWRGIRLRWVVSRADKAESDATRRQASDDFAREAKRELEYAREELAICELEQGPLSEAGQAARLLEAMSSRKWSWIRHQENFLTRSIDRKVRVLMDLQREHEASQRRAGAKTGENPGGGNPSEPAGDGGQPAQKHVSEPVEPVGGLATPEGAEFASAASRVVPSAGPVPLWPGNNEGNQGTKPLSGFSSATAWEPIETELLEVRAFLESMGVIESLKSAGVATVWSDVGLLN